MERSLNTTERNPQGDMFGPTIQTQREDPKKSVFFIKKQSEKNDYWEEDSALGNGIFSGKQLEKEPNSLQLVKKRPMEPATRSIPPGLANYQENQKNILSGSLDTSFPFSEYSSHDSIINDPNPNCTFSSLHNPNQPNFNDVIWDPFLYCANEDCTPKVLPSASSYKVIGRSERQQKSAEQSALINQQLRPQINSEKAAPTPIPQIIFHQYLGLQCFTQEQRLHTNDNQKRELNSTKKENNSNLVGRFSSPLEQQDPYEQIEMMLKNISTSIYGETKFLNNLCAQLKKQKPTLECIPTNQGKRKIFVVCMKVDNYCEFGEGNSKQDAKNMAARKLLRWITENDTHARNQLRALIEKDKSIFQISKAQNPITSELFPERDAVRNSAGDYSNCNSGQEVIGFGFDMKLRSQSLKDSTRTSNLKQKSSGIMNPDEFDSLAILNELSIDNNIPIQWRDTVKDEGYVSELIFGALPTFSSFSTKKKDSRRAAATKLYLHLIVDDQLRRKYLSKCEERKYQKGIVLPSSQDMSLLMTDHKASNSNREKKLQNTNESPSLEYWMSSDIFLELKTYLQGIDSKSRKDDIDRHLIEKLELLRLSDDEQTRIEIFCEYIAKIIEKATSQGKFSQIKPNEMSMSGLVKEIKLFPLGSFSLGHLRRDHLITDFSLVFEPLTENSPENIRPLVLETLFNYLKSENEAISAAGLARYQLDIRLEHLEDSNENKSCCLFIKDKNSGFGIRIVAAKKVRLHPDLKIPADYEAIIQIARVHQLLKRHSDLRENFNTYCLLLKYWRRKSGLAAVLRSDVIDLIAFDFALRFRTHSPGLGIYHILQTLTDTEATVQLLSKYNDSLAADVKNLPVEFITILQKACKDSLKNLYEGRFSHANF